MGRAQKTSNAGGILIRHLRHFLLMQSSSGPTPSSLRMSEVLALSRRLRQATLWSWSQSFDHYPDLMTVSRGRSIDGQVKHQLPLHHHGPAQCSQYCWCHTKLPFHLTLLFPITREHDPEIFELSRSGKQQLTPNLQVAHYHFLAGNLEVLTVTLAASHLAAPWDPVHEYHKQ